MVNFSYSIAVSLMIIFTIKIIPAELHWYISLLIWLANVILFLIYVSVKNQPLSPFRRIFLNLE